MLRGVAGVPPGGAASYSSITDTGLTAGRVVIVGTGGLLEDDAGLTYNKTTDALTTTTFVGALTGTASGNLVSGGALGTPSSGVVTNLTGTAAGVSIGGNAATATTATNQSGGTVNATTGDFSGNVTVNRTGAGNGIYITNTTGTVAVYANMTNTGGTLFVGLDSSAGASFGTAGNYGTVVYRPAATAFAISRAGTIDELISAAGAFKWPAYGSGAATFDASGNITSVSDISVKRNVRPYEKGLAEVVELARAPLGIISHGYTLESGLDQTKDDYAGFNANVVQTIFPEAVGKMADELEAPAVDAQGKQLLMQPARAVVKQGSLTLNPFVIVAAQTRAIEQLLARIEALEAK